MSARIEDAGDRLIIWNGNTDKRGALSPELYAAIIEASNLATDTRIRAVILTSEGPFFCAGGNLKTMIQRQEMDELERRERIEELHDVVRAIRNSPAPFVAAIEGGAAGAGLSLALACDLIVAADDAQFTAAYVKAGLVPDGGLTAHMARLIPRALATEMCLLGRAVPATRFAELGAVTRVVPKGQAMGAAQSLADHLARGPRVAQSTIRGLVCAAFDSTEASQLDRERDAMAAAMGAAEAQEGIAAFLEKRAPQFG